MLMIAFLKYDVLKMNQICAMAVFFPEMLNTAVFSLLGHLDGMAMEKMIMHFMMRGG